VTGISVAAVHQTPIETVNPLANLDAYVEATMQLLHPSSAAIVVSHGEHIVHERYLAGSAKGLPRVPIDEHTLFPLASVTKSFTAGVLMTLVARRVISLDQPIADFLAQVQHPGTGASQRSAVTFRHLASHTSGLQFPDGEDDGPLDALEVVTEPGTVFRYSETGMMVLQAAVEAATGKDWKALLDNSILEPLLLAHTRYVDEFDDRLALVPARAGEFETPEEHYFFTTVRSLTGSGLYASVRDLNRYGQLWALGGSLGEGPLFDPGLIKEATRTHGIFDYNGAHYGLLFWLVPAHGAMVMSGASHTVSAIVPESAIVVTVARNYHGEIPSGFVFHEDKGRLAAFAATIGKKMANP